MDRAAVRPGHHTGADAGVRGGAAGRRPRLPEREKGNTEEPAAEEDRRRRRDGGLKFRKRRILSPVMKDGVDLDK